MEKLGRLNVKEWGEVLKNMWYRLTNVWKNSDSQEKLGVFQCDIRPGWALLAGGQANLGRLGVFNNPKEPLDGTVFECNMNFVVGSVMNNLN